MINLLIVLVMYFPFYFAIVYKYTTLISKCAIFVWCAMCSSMIFLILELANYIHEESEGYVYKIVIPIILWGLLDMYFGIKVVLSDAPVRKITK